MEYCPYRHDKLLFIFVQLEAVLNRWPEVWTQRVNDTTFLYLELLIIA